MFMRHHDTETISFLEIVFVLLFVVVFALHEPANEDNRGLLKR